jgi:hypothetical protein
MQDLAVFASSISGLASVAFPSAGDSICTLGNSGVHGAATAAHAQVQPWKHGDATFRPKPTAKCRKGFAGGH